MNTSLKVSGSYLQDSKHFNVSDKFNVVQPAMIGSIMGEHGLNLATLSTGRAKHADKVDFQRTLSRYRGPELVKGTFLDLIYDSKHMGRGVDRILLGCYRTICTNGLFIGMNFFKHDIRHNGNTYDNLHLGIAAALGMQSKLAKTIETMQSVSLDKSQSELFALKAAELLVPQGAVDIRNALLRSRRNEDTGNDLWTIYNRVQENSMLGGRVAYKLETVDQFGGSNVRNMTTRQIKPNSGKDAEFNQKLFTLAESIAA